MDTFVTTAFVVGVKIAWLEMQTGVAYATLARHYGRWMPADDEREFDSAPLRSFVSASEERAVGPNDVYGANA